MSGQLLLRLVTTSVLFLCLSAYFDTYYTKEKDLNVLLRLTTLFKYFRLQGLSKEEIKDCLFNVYYNYSDLIDMDKIEEVASYPNASLYPQLCQRIVIHYYYNMNSTYEEIWERLKIFNRTMMDYITFCVWMRRFESGTNNVLKKPGLLWKKVNAPTMRF